MVKIFRHDLMNEGQNFGIDFSNLAESNQHAKGPKMFKRKSVIDSARIRRACGFHERLFQSF